MNSRKRTLGMLGVATAVLLATSACSGGLLGGGGGDKTDSGPIIIGMIVPTSGSSAPTGASMANGAKMAVDEINKAGGILDGRKLELQIADGACDAQQAVASANKLVSSGVVISVGGYCSGATLPTLPIFDKAGIPMIIPAANSQDLVKEGLKSVFLINGTGLQQSTAALTFIKKQGYKAVALVDDNTSYSVDITTETKKQIEADGTSKVVLKTSVNAGESDYSSAVRDIMGSGADLLYWTGYYQEGGLIIDQLRKAGYTGDIMVADGSADPTLATIAGPAAEGVYATMTPTPNTIKGAEGWIADYKAAFGDDPKPYSTQSYDAVRLAAAAFTAAGNTKTDDVIKALEGIKDFDAFSGPLSFTPEHTLANGGFVILVMKDGDFQLFDNLQ
ncbi:branched-chain amino acid transport system substrate-binding protein [Cryobacterium mesophilum]|nr:branched-chain amino acid ABC transporter substrate-binding protein [Terrimesophilobacter mesophilus]MBB5632971.1 branched-chain amino acid transport system substrate-binding protein [Terrimesophilobacter mesophilus]